jgi:2-hydroxy-6-oxonona-2,4-dienedioate hydrolase
VRYVSSVSPSNRSERLKCPILFIHGLGSSADRWMDLPEAFSSYFPAYAIDLLGFGKSDKPYTLKYDIPEFVKLIHDFIYKLRIDKKRISLIGHSLGGYVACEFALTHPLLARNLVLVDSSGMLRGPTPLLRAYLNLAMNPSYDECISVFRKMVVNPLFVSPLVVNTFIMNISNEQAKNAFKLTLENSATTQLDSERLKDIRIPTLIIWGTEDNVIPVEHASIFHKAIVGSQLKKIKNTGHAPFVEKPSVTFDIIRKFLVGS